MSSSQLEVNPLGLAMRPTWPRRLGARRYPAGWSARPSLGDNAVMATRPGLLRRGLLLEYTTLAWNVVGIVVLAWVAARSVALGGFGLDSLIEIGASTVVVWELTGTDPDRQKRALRSSASPSSCSPATSPHRALSCSSSAITPSTAQPASPGRPSPPRSCSASPGENTNGAALDNPVLRTEGRLTLVDGIPAAVLTALARNAAFGWWWADPLAGYVLVYYALREAREIFTH